jgi:hypothetical protein
MDISQFLISLLHGLSKLDFVEKVDFKTEVFVLKGRVILKRIVLFRFILMKLQGRKPLHLLKWAKGFGE